MQVGLEEMGDRPIHTLSGGQKQRIALARAFYHRRSVLVMDESTSSLDKFSENKILKSLSTLNIKLSIIIISHNESIKDFCVISYV